MQSAWHNPFQALSSGLSQGLADEIAKGLPEGLSQAELEEWHNQLKEIGEQYQGLMQDLLSRIAPSEAADSIYSDMRESFEAGAQSLMQNPTLLWETQAAVLKTRRGHKTRTIWLLCSSTYCFRRWWKSWLKA